MIRPKLFALSQSGITLLCMRMLRCCITLDRALELPCKRTFNLTEFTVRQTVLDAEKSNSKSEFTFLCTSLNSLSRQEIYNYVSSA